MKSSINSVGFVIVAFRNADSDLSELARTLLAAAQDCAFEAKIYLVANDEIGVGSSSNLEVIQGHGNVGFAAGVKLGALNSSEDYLVFVNPDCAPNRAEFRSFLTEVRPGRGILQPILRTDAGEFDYMPYENWTFTVGRQWSAWRCRKHLYSDQARKLPAYAKVSGAFLGMEREVALRLDSPFDSAFFLYAEDRDLTDRARAAGIPIVLLGGCSITHIGGESGKTVSELVERAKSDGSFRVAYRRYGRLGALLYYADQSLTDRAKILLRRSAAASAHQWTAKRWRSAGFRDPGPVTAEVLTQ
ncbi:glycosyltransferase family 2 protein [Rhodococcus rhodochrous]|uniref:glycosyltransferase family 2 protein n=1 Tax=Rhodococcus rhodochrous TaxID=1829 RepID=UPI0011AE2308|nr:glycosyltransferase family 2 protein [Rhodococcus rhodochrous]